MNLFAKSTCNPSWLAVEALPDKIGAFSLVKICLPVSFKNAFATLEKVINDCRPDLVICTGLAVKRNNISVERVAINVDDARIPDNEGHQPVDRVIDYSAPNAYFTGLPGKEIVARNIGGRSAGGSFRLSRNFSSAITSCSD